MQPFSVHCETCGARLKVRDPAAVGEIHACPKCESMVHILPPASLGAAAAATAAETAAAPLPTAGQIVSPDFGSEIDELLDPTPTPAVLPAVEQTPQTPQTPTPAEAPAAEAPPAPPAAAAPESVQLPEFAVAQEQTSSATAEVVATESAAASFAFPEEPTPPVSSGFGLTGGLLSAMGQTSLLIWGSMAAVTLVALGAIGIAWSGPSTKGPTPAVAQQTSNKNTSAKATLPVVVETRKPAVEVVEQKSSAMEVAASLVVSPLPNDTLALNNAAPPPPLPALPSLPAEEVEPSLPEETPAAPDPDAPLPLLDPLAFDSANLDLLLIPTPATPPATTSAPLDAQKPALEEPAPGAPDPLRLALGSRPTRRFEPGSAVRGPSSVEAFTEGEVKTRLAMPLAEIRWTEVPLHQALAELGSLAGVPITLDPTALRMAASSAATPVSLVQNDATIEEIAAALAAKVRLTVAQQPGGLVVVKKGADLLRKVDYRVGDLLAAGDTDASALADLIRAMVAPESWAAGDKANLIVQGDSLSVEQPAALHYQILLFCERLRKARGLATRSRYPRSRIQVEPRLVALQARLSRPTTFAFVDWTPLVQVFDYWQESSDLVILVDWQALAAQDQRPMSTVVGSVNHLAWGDALDATLHPLDLDWVPVDDKTIQVTTRAAASREVWVEFYRATDVGKLRERIAQACDEISLDSLVIQTDAAGKLIIVRGNRQVHKAASSR